ncbi:MAG: hypothetical protein RL693_777, partial [Verrucomicrobiota bacterium]
MNDDVIELTEIEPGIVIIRMQDRAHKNTFSHELSRELIRAFATVAASETYKVVILTGYDTYFASGGTQEDLL